MPNTIQVGNGAVANFGGAVSVISGLTLIIGVVAIFRTRAKVRFTAFAATTISLLSLVAGYIAHWWFTS